MLNKIIRFSLHNRLVVLLAAVLLIAGGTYMAFTMEVDVFPDLNAPTVTVMTEAGGMAPEEVERLVTFPVETAVNGATGVRRVRSQSTTGFSVVWVEFDWGTDIYRARQIVSEKLSEINGQLPVGVERPVLGPQSSILGEVMIVGLTADSTSMEDLRTLADWTVRPRLLATGGVAAVSVLGGDAREYQILLQPDRMKYYDVSLTDVLEAVDGMNRNASGGVLYEHGNEYIIRGVIHTNRPDELARTVVKQAGGAPVLLGQVARIATGARSPRTGTASNRLKPAVIVTVTKQAHTGTLELTDRLDAALEELQTELPSDVRMDSRIFRQSRFIESAIGNIRQSLFEGGLFVALVLFVFLMNVRTTVISLVTIPLALLVTLLVLNGMGLTINTMSIGGMAIAIGSLVDDAIVDVENVFRRLRENRLLPEAERLSVRQVVFEASREVRIPILNSTLIIVASFMPLFFLSGMEGRMLVPLGVAFIVSLFASTAVALTLTPVLCSYLLGSGRSATGAAPAGETGWVRRLKNGYIRLLRGALDRRKLVLTLTGVAVLAALGVFFTLGRSFLPPFNEGSFTINVSTLPGVSLDESDRIGQEAERLLLSVPEIVTVARKTGRAELDEHSLGVNTSEIEAPFELAERSRAEVLAEVRHKLSELSGVNVEIGQPISHRIDAMLSGTQANIAIKLFGPDLNRLYGLGHRIKEAVADVEGVADLNVEQQIERPQLKIVPRREMLAKYGVSPAVFAEWVEVWLGGRVVGQVYEENRAFDLTVRADDENRATAEAIRKLTVDTPSGKVPLEVLAEITSAAGPNTINRENVARKLVVSANVAGRDLRSVVNDMRRRIEASVPMPEGYRVEYGGQFESEQAASRILGLTSLLSVLIIFVLLYHQFRSTSQALVVLLNLPLALIGGVLALALSDGVVSIPAIIGFISLFGIATRNGILLIDRYNDLHRQGLSLRESVLQGSADRLNPIVMTALTSALALIPLVIGDDLPGNEIQSPMAKVMLGGLLSSTLLNGFVIPVMYLLVRRRDAEGGPGTAPAAGRYRRQALSAGTVGLLLLALCPQGGQAQNRTGMEAWLDTIEQNNTLLQAVRAEQEAQSWENRAEQVWADPEVEFHYLWGTESSGDRRKDVSVMQTLDWATLTGAGRRVVRRQDGVAAWQYRQDRNAVRREAARRLLEAVYLNRRVRLLAARAEEAGQLADGYEAKMNRGAAHQLEVNKARMEAAARRADWRQAEAERRQLFDELRALNGGCEVAFADTVYGAEAALPADFDAWYAGVEAVHPALRRAGEEVELSRAKMRQARREAIPPISVGYMSERSTDEGFRGLAVGVSVPLWGARTRLKQSRAAVTAARSREADIRLQVRAALQGLYHKAVALQQVSTDYNRVLQQASSAPLLRKALEAGSISLLDYLTELSQLYEATEQAWAAERDFRLALTELEAATW